MTINFIEANLTEILAEISKQPTVGMSFPIEQQSYTEQIEQIREYIEEAGEYGIAYESMISMLEIYPFKLSGCVAIRLLEVGLLMKFKTERTEDSRFDSR